MAMIDIRGKCVKDIVTTTSLKLCNFLIVEVIVEIGLNLRLNQQNTYQ